MTFPSPDADRVERALDAMHTRRAKLRRARIVAVSGVAALVLAIAVVASVAASSPGHRNSLDVSGPAQAGSTTTDSGSTSTSTLPPRAESSTAFPGPPPGPDTVPSGAETTTPTTAFDPGVLHGTVVDQQGNPVAGIGVYDSASYRTLLRTDQQGQFQIRCAPNPDPKSTLIDDPILLSPWQPGFGSAVPGGGTPPDARSVAPTLGWTYAAASGVFTGPEIFAPFCAELPNPLRIVLPAAATLEVTLEDPNGNVMPATSVSLWLPGMDENSVQGVLHDESSYYGAENPWEEIYNENPQAEGNALRYWQSTTDASGTATFTSLSPALADPARGEAGGYSVWVGNLLTTCSSVNVTAGATMSLTCRVIPAPATTSTTVASSPSP